MIMNYEDLTQSQAILLAVHYIDKEGDDALQISKEDQEARMNICSSCEYCVEVVTPLSDLERYGGKEKVHGCQQCGCILEDKTGDMFSKCPIEKWDQNFNNWDDVFYPNMLEYFKQHGINHKEW